MIYRKMKQETIKSIIFSVLIGLVFAVSLFLIIKEEQALDRQLKAAVFSSEDLTGKLAGQAEKKALSDCLDWTYDVFEDLWNQECEDRELEEKCDLPKDIATGLLDGYQNLKQGCY